MKHGLCVAFELSLWKTITLLHQPSFYTLFLAKVLTEQVILSHLAKSPQGLSLNDLVELTGIDESNLQTALDTLTRHDVIAENQGRWKIIVELFRLWVEKSHPLNLES
ncbi:helix-turn-helix domain-containing protein [Anabaena aphanizomenioides LEGE 00250]|uniref:Helix-turn-helix domain-containing protein n=1 Tax=Sphaerospermopsis aphanizomenoides LEGE 00250 TaxID=2777972 RepID=A0ABR9V916_9CYAN|nr:helix-turn-helix domain-containing protein [Sphaerospermopsis aphanizomenoides LEGE 00250]